MTPEREAVLREQARTGMVDVGSLPDALAALDAERTKVYEQNLGLALATSGMKELSYKVAQLRERNAKLERVAKAAFAVNEWCEDYSGDAGVGMSIVDRDAMIALDDALAALDATP